MTQRTRPDAAERRTAGGLRALPAALLLLLLLLAQPTPVAAHAVLSDSTPAAGATVEDLLAEVVLEFSEPVEMPRVVVVDPAGAPVTDGAARAQGQRVVQPLAELSEEGRYTVAYRAVSDDGHPIEGELTFTYAGPSGGAQESTVEGRAEAPPTSAVPEETSAGAPGDPPAEEAAAGMADGGAGDGGLGLLLLAALLVGALGVTAWSALRRRPSP